MHVRDSNVNFFSDEEIASTHATLISTSSSQWAAVARCCPGVQVHCRREASSLLHLLYSTSISSACIDSGAGYTHRLLRTKLMHRSLVLDYETSIRAIDIVEFY
jgi:hypothetical protein